MKEKPVVLIVEGNENMVALNRTVLEMKGYGVRDVRCLADARGWFAGGGTADVMLLNLELPDGNGLDFLPELRCLTTAPVLVLTGMYDFGVGARALESGASAYLKMPYRIDDLCAHVKDLLGMTTREGAVPDNATPSRKAEECGSCD